MLGIYSPKGSLCEVYFTLAEVTELREKPVRGELLVRVENSRARVLEAKLASAEVLSAFEGVEAVLDVDIDPRVLYLAQNLVWGLSEYCRIQREIPGCIKLVLSIVDTEQIAGLRASVDVASSLRKSRLCLPPGYGLTSDFLR